MYDEKIEKKFNFQICIIIFDKKMMELDTNRTFVFNQGGGQSLRRENKKNEN